MSSERTLEQRIADLEQQSAAQAEAPVNEGTRKLRAKMAEDRANAEAFQAEVDRDMRELEQRKERWARAQRPRE
jgi:hypothetical protein